jgi:predicted ATP-grasp superfamily ATP-dependent carboligase
MTDSTPFEFVPVHGSNFDVSKFKGTQLVMPCMSAGMSSSIAVDYYIINENSTKAGYLNSDYISPSVQNDALTPEGDQ